MDVNEAVSGLMQELRRGTLIMLALSELRTPMYGYDLVKRLEKAGVNMEANTLYPLMRRLEGQGLLESRWETGGSKPRKYYQLTPEGAFVLEKIKDYWKDFSHRISALLEKKKQ